MITKDLEGIVFNLFSYKENDLIVDVLSPQHGFMQLYVRGAQKTTSKSFFIFKSFNIIKFDVTKLNLKELSIYKSGTVIEIFDYTKLNYEQMNGVMYLSEALLKIKQLQDYNPQEYYLDIKEVIHSINIKKNHSTHFLINYFLYRTLIVLGCAPILTCCGFCGSINNIVAYDLNNSCFICQNCFNDETKYLKNKEVLGYLYSLNKGIENNQNKSADKTVFEVLSSILVENAGVYLLAQKYIY